MNQDTSLTEQESLSIITEMMQKVKTEFYDTGISALLWGVVISFCGLFCFAGSLLNWKFDYYMIWNLTFIAVIPQIWITIRERKKAKATPRTDSVAAVWMVFALSMFGLVFYFSSQVTNVPSSSSLYLLVYTMPTLTTGLARQFKPMIIGAIICYISFVISCYADTTYDMLLQAIAAIACWLIPGIILHQRYKRSRARHV
ncbi:MAG: hypothetical protein IM548_09015 [Chitinophagaceae bacterium]|jgi:hypothetical protein|nr:hypothetical protein [Chitinophagaceae bacterium]MCE2973447.1 hypothetical protein [Sediminibacterium sp.]MCA6473741.1 hypothetical protein [Chitinophagaceae bacterium]MCA6481203.1 hypothetical protein [Chitinophagaceae bacterium]MCA6481782.1 hypothetical protein [Chitinophagaceae bacterium]